MRGDRADQVRAIDRLWSIEEPQDVFCHGLEGAEQGDDDEEPGDDEIAERWSRLAGLLKG